MNFNIRNSFSTKTFKRMGSFIKLSLYRETGFSRRRTISPNCRTSFSVSDMKVDDRSHDKLYFLKFKLQYMDHFTSNNETACELKQSYGLSNTNEAQ